MKAAPVAAKQSQNSKSLEKRVSNASCNLRLGVDPDIQKAAELMFEVKNQIAFVVNLGKIPSTEQDSF